MYMYINTLPFASHHVLYKALRPFLKNALEMMMVMITYINICAHVKNPNHWQP